MPEPPPTPPDDSEDTASTDDEWDPELYDDGHSFVYEYGADLVRRLDPAPEDRILDLGCGTGHLTGAIADSGATAVGIDRARGMVSEAATTFPACAFLRGDVRALPFERSFDGVVSNAVLHWVPAEDQDAVLADVHGVLRPGGPFVLEMGGTGNVTKILRAVREAMARRGYATDDPWYFPTVGEYTTRLEAAGFEIQHARLFDRPTELEDGQDGLRNWLSMFGDDLLAPLSDDERAAVLAEVEATLEPDLFRDGTWVADYRRLRVVAVSEAD